MSLAEKLKKEGLSKGQEIGKLPLLQEIMHKPISSEAELEAMSL
jgi:hypothetical protein